MQSHAERFFYFIWDFIQDICYDISEVVEEINDQLDDLYDRLITYNELAEKYGILPEMRSLVQTSPVSDSADEEKLPFPADEEDIV